MSDDWHLKLDKWAVGDAWISGEDEPLQSPWPVKWQAATLTFDEWTDDDVAPLQDWTDDLGSCESWRLVKTDGDNYGCIRPMVRIGLT